MPTAVILFIVLGIVLVSGIILIAVKMDKKRTNELEETAAELGLKFVKYADQVTNEARMRFELFSKGRGRKSWNAIYGETGGTGVWIFDYQYTTGGGKNSTTHYQTVICFASTNLNLPRFNLYPEGMMSRIGSSVFGMQDIDFDTHPDFSKKYVLKGDSEDMIREAFHEDLLSFFELQDKELRVEGDRDQLLMYRPRRKVKPLQIQDFLAEGFRVFSEFQPQT